MFTDREDIIRNAETVGNLVEYALTQQDNYGEGLVFIDEFSEVNQRDACALAVELAGEALLRWWATEDKVNRGLTYWGAKEELLRRRKAGLLAPIYECTVLWAPIGYYGELIKGACEFDDWDVCRVLH